MSACDCPFEAYIPGESLVHGDACPPNSGIGDGGLNGYIDLGGMGVGQVEVDRSAAVCRLQSASARAGTGVFTDADAEPSGRMFPR